MTTPATCQPCGDCGAPATVVYREAHGAKKLVGYMCANCDADFRRETDPRRFGTWCPPVSTACIACVHENLPDVCPFGEAKINMQHAGRAGGHG